MVVLLAGLVGWLWFATREAAEATPSPAPRARRADLSALKAQVDAAPRVAMIEPPEIHEIETADESPAIEPDDPNLLADEQRDADVSGLMAQLEAAQQRANDLAEAETFDEALLDETVGHEVITIMGHAPIIDTSTATHCGAIVDDYTVNIPTGRTFEGVLGGAADSQGQDDGTEGVSFSSNDTLENVFIVDGITLDEPVTEDKPVVEDHVIEPAGGY